MATVGRVGVSEQQLSADLSDSADDLLGRRDGGSCVPLPSLPLSEVFFPCVKRSQGNIKYSINKVEHHWRKEKG